MAISVANHVVAIGTSTSGIVEKNLFFDTAPLNNIAYVIFQQLFYPFGEYMVVANTHTYEK